MKSQRFIQREEKPLTQREGEGERDRIPKKDTE
jgi:hypothetical protein